VPDPIRYFTAGLTQVLREAGIQILGGATAPVPDTAAAGTDTAAAPRPAAPPAPATAAGRPPADTAVDTLFTWQSPPLAAVLQLMLKPSQNQIGETLLRALGAQVTGFGSMDSGRAVVRRVLTGFGVPPDAYVQADGSGLSRYNYVAPEALAEVLEGMYHRPDFEPFYDALPVAGVDGTLATRFLGTAAAGNVHAKTGTLSNVRSLSGYVRDADGELLVFVLLVNNFTVPVKVVDVAQDRIVERLATFSRRGAAVPVAAGGGR
jgi:serine-type D-Ala-D-Ala carboxypeptidase/endopeptidase (penicillin-binding protein 4)